MAEEQTAAEAGGGPPPGLARLWAGWRSAYIDRLNGDDSDIRSDAVGRSLFERILDSGLPDDEAFVVHRGTATSVVLNAYPYGSGHLLVVPNRAAPDLADLTGEEVTDLWATVTTAVGVLRAVYDPGGVNVGANLGAAAGAGVPDHLHVHVLPRWQGDTNFLTTVAETRVLPEPLADTYRKVRAAWPT